MFITFNIEPVYHYLILNGFVYTVRHWPAEKHPHNNFTHPVNHLYEFPGINVQVKTIEPLIINNEVFPYVLEEYYQFSGFNSAAEWFKAIKLKPDMWLLKATITGGRLIDL